MAGILDPTDPKLWILLVELHAIIARACKSPDAAKRLILDWARKRSRVFRSHPEVEPDPHACWFDTTHWGTSDSSGEVIVDMRDGVVIRVQKSLNSPYSREGVAYERSAEMGWLLPDGIYRLDVVRLLRADGAEILRSAGLPVPPELLVKPEAEPTPSRSSSPKPSTALEPKPKLSALKKDAAKHWVPQAVIDFPRPKNLAVSYAEYLHGKQPEPGRWKVKTIRTRLSELRKTQPDIPK